MPATRVKEEQEPAQGKSKGKGKASQQPGWTRHQAYVAQVAEKYRASSTIFLPSADLSPEDFKAIYKYGERGPRSGRKSSARVTRDQREWEADGVLRRLPETGDLWVSSMEAGAGQNGKARFDVIRDDRLPPDAVKRLEEAWLALERLNPDRSGRNGRSGRGDAEAAWHGGVSSWSARDMMPTITRDTLQSRAKGAHAAALASAINHVLSTFGSEVAGRAWAMLRERDPDGTAPRLEALPKCLGLDYAARTALQSCPAVKAMLPMCTSVAVQRGISASVHLDATDDVDSYAVFTAVGSGWTGGELQIPQLGIAIPVRPGQILLFRAGLFRHIHSCENPQARISFTGFIDYKVFRCAERSSNILSKRLLRMKRPTGGVFEQGAARDKEDWLKATRAGQAMYIDECVA